MFDVVYDWYLRAAVKNKIAVHRVNIEIVWDSVHGGTEALGDDSTAVDASSPRRVP